MAFLTRTLFSDHQASSQELAHSLLIISERGWKPLLFTSALDLLETIGLDRTSEAFRHNVDLILDAHRLCGDLFFGDRTILYVFLEPDIVQRSYHPRPLVGRLSVGGLGTAASDIESDLRALTAALTMIVEETTHGVGTQRHLAGERKSILWTPEERDTPKLSRLVVHSGTPEPMSPPATFATPSATAEQTRAAQLLAEHDLRTLAVTISRSGLLRHQDLVGRRSKALDGAETLLERLVSVGVLAQEHLLECRQTSKPITRVPDLATLRETQAGALACPHCNSPFRDETASVAYRLSDLGKLLIQKSHWMTIWVTSILTESGIPSDAIIWNLSDRGEEVDILAEFEGELWIFELKDREFGAGDAYPLAYRAGRYGADRVFVVTTTRVSREAKHVFEELRDPNRHAEMPYVIHVEGLHAAAATLESHVTRARFHKAFSRFTALGRFTIPRLHHLAAARLGLDISEWDLSAYDDDVPF